jgi:hypothetical protein
VLILDKLDDLEKAGIVAKVFAALVLGKIDEKTFRQLAAAIDIGFLEDLVALSQDHASRKPKLMRSLLRTGLVEIDEKRDSMMVGNLAPTSLGLAYKINELGLSFVECLNCASSEAAKAESFNFGLVVFVPFGYASIGSKLMSTIIQNSKSFICECAAKDVVLEWHVIKTPQGFNPEAYIRLGLSHCTGRGEGTCPVKDVPGGPSFWDCPHLSEYKKS